MERQIGKVQAFNLLFAKDPKDQLVADLSVPIKEDSPDLLSSLLHFLSLDDMFPLKTWERETRI